MLLTEPIKRSTKIVVNNVFNSNRSSYKVYYQDHAYEDYFIK